MAGQRDMSRDPETGRFLTGNSGGGRQKGSRNKLSELFWDDLYQKWQHHGASAIDRMIAEKPGDFVRVVASQMPAELNVSKSPLGDLSDDELATLLQTVRGLIAGGPGAGAGDGTADTVKH